MDIIIISGPTGSGKTTLASRIYKKVINGIILSTDNYYKTGLISKLLSKCLRSYFDRRISFNDKLFRKDLNFIIKNKESKHTYSYDFKRKNIKKIFIHKKNIKCIIVEGIFAREFISNLNVHNCVVIELTTNKSFCMNKAIKRDIRERGKNKKIAESDFLNSWNFYHLNKNINSKNNFIKINLSKENDLEQFLNKIIK